MQVKTGRRVARDALACGGSPRAARTRPVEVIVKPGITAIEQSSALACDADLLTLQTAIENFTLLNVDPPAAESDLVPDWLRSESAALRPRRRPGRPRPRLRMPRGARRPAAAAPAEPAALRPKRRSTTGRCACSTSTRRSEVAIEAYYAMNGTSTVPTEQASSTPGSARARPSYDVDLGGNLVAVPGGACDGVEVRRPTRPPRSHRPAPPAAPVNCRGVATQDARSLESRHGGVPRRRTVHRRPTSPTSSPLTCCDRDVRGLRHRRRRRSIPAPGSQLPAPI